MSKKDTQVPRQMKTREIADKNGEKNKVFSRIVEDCVIFESSAINLAKIATRFVTSCIIPLGPLMLA